MPPPLELECLQALWQIGNGSVRDIQEALSRRRPLAYTTVMTLLARLARRGAVDRRKVGRCFLYTPTVSEEMLRDLAVREVIRCHFGGSEPALAMYLDSRRNSA
ncbi:MAG: BlaI/MecI/CopY family transcriptional regulator [Bryobacteraceae bacterium]|nr:BlaI/MecI/CopY family transcriptional regulator [Bryobacteraceae bacterium]